MARNSSQPKAPSQRQLRVGEMIRHALAEMLTRGEVQDETLNSHVITVSEVRMTPNLRTAIVYVVPLGSEDLAPVLKAFEKNTKFIRHSISQSVNLKYAPDLKFVSDESFAEANRIDELLASPKVRQDLEG